VYIERRMQPLNLHVEELKRDGDEGRLRVALREYGNAIKELAGAGIFPGDMLLKNFGVSRHGRLIFYDYDELAPLSECRFRELPHSSDDRDELAGEPWYYVGERDIFPEEFRTFLGLSGDLLQTFLAHHEELLGVSFWHRMQDVHARGEVLDIFPYKAARRLRRDDGDRPGPPREERTR
jgi:isocitrate dehydrogenase kinase/phosphatase